MLSVGDAAPDFELAGVDGRTGDDGTYRLSSYRGGPVLLVFYPSDGSSVCKRQLAAYTADIAEFDRVGAQVLAISPQSPSSHAAFAQEQGGLAFPLLSDEDKAVGAAFGIIGFLGLYRRSAFVVAPDGSVAYAHRAVAGLTFRPTQELVRAVESGTPH